MCWRGWCTSLPGVRKRVSPDRAICASRLQRYVTYRMETTGAARAGENVLKMPAGNNVVKSARAFNGSGGETFKSKSG